MNEFTKTNTPKEYNLAFAVFSFLFFWAIFFDSRSNFYKVFDYSLTDFEHIIKIAMCFSGVLTLIKPSSVYRFIVFLIFLIIDILLSLPIAPNHTVFEMLIAFTVVTCFVIGKIKYKTDFNTKNFYQLFAPVLRLQVLILYFWAVVHKFNKGFFDKYISCATVQIFNIKQTLTILPAPEWFISINPYFTILIEGSIPILLLIPKTRLFGVMVGVLFHFVLGFRYTGFTIMIYSLFALFIAESNYEKLEPYVNKFTSFVSSSFSKISNYRNWNKSYFDYLVVQIGLVLSILVLLRISISGGPFSLYILSTEGIYILLCLVFFVSLIVILVNKRFKIVQNVLLIPDYKILLIFPIIFFINGFFPHIGLKNIQTVAMFSNLQTGGGKTNHLFIPASFQIFPYLNDLVEIKGSNSKTLNQFSGYTSIRPMVQTSIKFPNEYVEYLENSGIEVDTLYRYTLPFIKLKDFVTDNAKKGRKGLRIEYVRNGKTYYTANAELDQELNSASVFEQKFLSQRAMPDDERGLCMW